MSEPSRARPATSVAELCDAAVRLGATTIWSDVSLTIERGEFVAILGPNGAGKSTLLRVLLGLLPLQHGTISVLGGAPGEQNRAIGYVPQRHGFDAATRIRGSISCDSASTAIAGGFPSPDGALHADA